MSRAGSPASPPAKRPFSWRRTWLIARRELRERTAQKAYRVVLVVGALFVAGVVIVPTLFGGGDDTPTASKTPAVFVDASGGEATARALAIERASRAGGGPGLDLRVVELSEARRLVRTDEEPLALVIAGPPAAPRVQILQRPNAAQTATDEVAAVQRAAVEARLAALPAAERRRALAPVSVEPVTVEAAGSSPAAAAVVGIMTLVLYLVGLLLNTAFANGIVSDRAGRIIERLLTAAKPEEHLAGKLIGVGAAGLLQLGAWMVTGLLAGLVVAGDLADTFSGVPGLLLAWFPVSVLLTYVLYAALATLLVLPVRRIEDVAGAVGLAAMLQIVAYIAATTIVAPGSTVGPVTQALSLVPFFAPILMLPRIAAGDVAAWELAIGALGPLLLAVLLIRLAAPAYARHAIDAPGGKGLAATIRALRR